MRMDQVQTHQNQEKMLQHRDDTPAILNMKTSKTDDHGKKKTSLSLKPGLNITWLLQPKLPLDHGTSSGVTSQQVLGKVMTVSQ